MTENVTCIKWDRSCLRWEIPYRYSCDDRGLGSSRVFNKLPVSTGWSGLGLPLRRASAWTDARSPGPKSSFQTGAAG